MLVILILKGSYCLLVNKLFNIRIFLFENGQFHDIHGLLTSFQCDIVLKISLLKWRMIGVLITNKALF